jgi:hypothetical protein
MQAIRPQPKALFGARARAAALGMMAPAKRTDGLPLNEGDKTARQTARRPGEAAAAAAEALELIGKPDIRPWVWQDKVRGHGFDPGVQDRVGLVNR